MNPSYTKSQRLLEHVSIGLFALLTIWSLGRLIVAAEWHAAPVLLVAVPLGWLASDILSGVLHWAFDTCGSVDTPIIGKSLIRPFREHHTDPRAMTRHDFVETHGASCLAALPFLAATSLMALESVGSFLAQSFLLSIALGALATNQCHKWAHMEEASTPAFVHWLQRYRVVLPRRHHQLHHTPPFNSHFCMSNGLLNPLFNAVLRAWR